MFILEDKDHNFIQNAWVSRNGKAFKWSDGTVSNSPTDGTVLHNSEGEVAERLREVIISNANEPGDVDQGHGTTNSIGAASYNAGQDQWEAQRTFVANPAPPPPVMPTIIPYVDFDDRFTDAERDALTDYVYGAGQQPNRRLVRQALHRSTAKGEIDLEDAKTIGFMDILVAEAIITSERKTEILTP
jgi:hypothetical protein